MLQLFAETAAATGGWNPVMAKAIMVAFGMAAPAISIGLIGSNVMKAVGRNPEAAKSLGQIIVIAAMVELMALLTFGAVFVVGS
jgi:F0F1-type ATP synthase membrane subunit c/vacuolar-type H+-ATPase subunit K